MDPRHAYEELLRLKKEHALFGSVGSVLGWDQRTYMPAGGSAHRAAQLALLAGMSHQMATNPRVGELLAALEGTALVADPESAEAVNVREIRRSYDRATKLPRDLVEELSRTTSQAYDVWVQARKENAFAPFQPWLERIVGLIRRKADALGWKESRYDALLDGYEPGATAAEIRRVFDPLQAELSALVKRVTTSGKRAPRGVLDREYPVAAQEALCRVVSTHIGFDYARGRLDVTTHPFCSGFGPGDTRLTTRYDERNFAAGFFATLHEAGHGLYNQGLDPARYGTPMGEAVSLGVHESQSRLWENFVGRSRAFWKFFMPRARKAFTRALGRTSLDDLYWAVNDCHPSFIRVEADEATYNLHIMLRFELEVALVEGTLSAADVPEAWHAAFKRLLGLKVPDDARGCLQDVHWSGAGLGYFPTYTLGNLYAAQFFEQARADLGDLEEGFARGDFTPLLRWLQEKIHRQGKRHSAGRLCEVVTGRPLGHAALMRHLEEKLGALYER